jgi:hypothetical protein
MSRTFVAFDIETAKEVPGNTFNWKRHRPLGITCIASQSSLDESARVWFSTDANGAPAAQMSRDDVASFIRHLSFALEKGAVPLSWNGLAFDFDILAEESGLPDECRRLARQHVDMMFQVVCERGFPVSLQSAAIGLGIQGKLDGVSGLEAPGLWKQGEYDTVMQYVAQDVRVTLEVALVSEQRRAFAWRTQKGSISKMPLPHGWLTVDDAADLPLPDTSWMTSPPSRDSYLSWLG